MSSYLRLAPGASPLISALSVLGAGEVCVTWVLCNRSRPDFRLGEQRQAHHHSRDLPATTTFLGNYVPGSLGRYNEHWQTPAIPQVPRSLTWVPI
ncbi:hypothetical protein PISMIDRAFT_674035, partial [Pisolithus microcarpus 441]